MMTNTSHTDAAYRVLVASSEERQRIEQLVTLAQTQPGWQAVLERRLEGRLQVDEVMEMMEQSGFEPQMLARKFNPTP